ncbi:MAG: hypothetical protein PHP82_01840 [Candidatus ainarchaeum sp.]|nr:hypothetical protein [Candidatus ainarchaeum sp.]
MNFPVGDVIAKAPLPVNIVTVANELKKINFNGYIIMSVNKNCFEEGVLFFREGDFYAAMVECVFAEKNFKGDNAIEYILNQTVGNGFFQTVQLVRSQVDLVTAFDEKLLFRNKINLKDLPKLIPSTFRDNFILQEQNEDILNKYGLSSLGKKSD